MQYLDDLMDLIDGLPEEMDRRFSQIKKWDQEVERLRLESNDMQKRITEGRGVIEKKERERMLMELADKNVRMLDLSEQKMDLAEKSERLMRMVLDKVSESSYHCKIELEVDNPGCTEAIERKFSLTVPQVSLNTMGFEIDTDRMSVVSDETATSRPVGRPRSVATNSGTKKKHAEEPSSKASSKSGSRTSSPAPPVVGHNFGKKYKKKKDAALPANAATSQMSAYMRKKHEKIREQQKLQEIHNRRVKEEERKRFQKENAHVPQLDIATFCAQACGTPEDIKRESSLTPSGGHEEEDNLSWGAGIGGSEDDFDPNEALDLFPSMLPSPPREIMESLKEDSMFGLDDPMNFGINVSPSGPNPTSFPMLGNGTPTHSATKSQSASAVHYRESSVDPKKKKNLMFGSVSDTSMHGRPRKLTDRAVELLQMAKSKEKGRKRDDEDSNEKWCVCREGSSGAMIECEAPSCPIGWFHFECIGLSSEPAGKWYCHICKKDYQN